MEGGTGRISKDKYGKLRAFAIMLVTEDEQQFCDCYAYCTGYDKPVRAIGHYIWHKMDSLYIRDLRRKNYEHRKQKYAEYTKSWQKEHKERCLEYARKYRARKKGGEDAEN